MTTTTKRPPVEIREIDGKKDLWRPHCEAATEFQEYEDQIAFRDVATVGGTLGIAALEEYGEGGDDARLVCQCCESEFDYPDGVDVKYLEDPEGAVADADND